MKFKLKSLIFIIAIAVMLTACNTTVDKKSEDKKDNETTEASKPMTEEEENEAWKKEAFYGKTIKVGYNGGLCTGGPGVAKVLGLFEKNGLDVEIVNVQSFTDAIGTGKVQMISDHIATMLVPAVNGIDMTIKAGAQTGCKSLYVLNNDKINSTKDFIGKSIGLLDGIGNSQNIAYRFLNHDNVDINDVKFVPVDPAASILALENGEVDGLVLSDQFAEKFVNEGKIKMIRSLTYDDDFKEEPCCVYLLNKTFEKENPITAKKITKVLFEAGDYIANNIEDATQIMFDNNWASGDFDQAVRMMKSYNWKVTNDMTGTALRSCIDDYKKFGVIKTEKSTDEILKDLWHPEDFKHDEK